MSRRRNDGPKHYLGVPFERVMKKFYLKDKQYDILNLDTVVASSTLSAIIREENERGTSPVTKIGNTFSLVVSVFLSLMFIGMPVSMMINQYSLHGLDGFKGEGMLVIILPGIFVVFAIFLLVSTIQSFLASRKAEKEGYKVYHIHNCTIDEFAMALRHDYYIDVMSQDTAQSEIYVIARVDRKIIVINRDDC